MHERSDPYPSNVAGTARVQPRRRTFRSPWSRAATPSTRSTTARSRSSIATASCSTRRAIPAFVTMTRSALKPFQAMPFVAAGGVERFGYSPAQVALLCASHSGEPRHVEAVADMLAAAGNSRGRPPVRNARAGLLRRARRSAAAAAVFAARAQLLRQAQRHARVLRPVRTAEGDLPRVRPSVAAGDTARRCALHCRRPEARARRGHRRMLGAELRGPARAPGARRSRGSPPTATIADYGTAPRDPGRCDDRASGDGVRRESQRPRADARRRAATGWPRSAPRASRRSASAAAGSGIAVKVVDGSEARPPSGDGGDARRSSDLLDARTRAPSSRRGANR